MGKAGGAPLRVAVVGGGPAGTFFALYALRYASLAGCDLSITIYEAKDFRHFGRAGCNMCAGIVPAFVLARFAELGLSIPPQLILNRISSYSLHTPAGALSATQPDAQAEILSVYRGAGPLSGASVGSIGFDQMLLEEAESRGARLKRSSVQAIRRAQPHPRPIEVVSGDETEEYDLVVLATGVNPQAIQLQVEGFHYRPPRTELMCQAELHLGRDEVERRLASAVHVFLPPDDIAAFGILIPKGPFVTVSLLNTRQHMHSLSQFLALDDVSTLVGTRITRVCGCQARTAIGPAKGFVGDGLVAIGDAAATRLYKNGLGSALVTAERAAWTAIYRGWSKEDFRVSYLPLCRAIGNDNRLGRLLFLEVPLLKRSQALAMAHCRLAAEARQGRHASELHARVLWGMFTGTHSYGDMLRMAVSPDLVIQLALALASSLRKGKPLR